MTGSARLVERRLRASGILLILGLLIEAVCLFWARPLSFLTFIGVGGALLFLGVFVYLFSLVSIKPCSPDRDS
ncbi:MAG TPA: hypothetical protein VOA64_11515 [Candidatus Dormibacteraeota bacterium]|nr:hypothetical protein [Candidatus Dormibacteraeota bacterium]